MKRKSKAKAQPLQRVLSFESHDSKEINLIVAHQQRIPIPCSFWTSSKAAAGKEEWITIQDVDFAHEFAGKDNIKPAFAFVCDEDSEYAGDFIPCELFFQLREKYFDKNPDVKDQWRHTRAARDKAARVENTLSETFVHPATPIRLRFSRSSELMCSNTLALQSC